jgi:hypothetical protein
MVLEALGPLKEDAFPPGDGLMQELGGVREVGLKPLPHPRKRAQDALRARSLPAIIFREEEIFLFNVRPHLLREGPRLEEVGEADAHALHLVGIGGSDAPVRGPDPLRPASMLLGLVHQAVIGKGEVTEPGDEQAALDPNPPLLQPGDLIQQFAGVQGHPVSDQAELAGIEDARGHEVQDRFLFAHFDRVPGVGPALEPADHVGLLGQEVHDPPLALVPPLRAHDHGVWHI